MITFPMTEAMPSRVATSICNALDCAQEMVCESFYDYSRKAKKFALGNIKDLSEA